MAKNAYRLWIAALLLGWAFDFLFWKKYIGINFPIFLSLCLILGFVLLLTYHIKPNRKSLWLLVPLLFFAAITVLRNEPLTLGLAFLFSLLCAGLLAVTYLGGRWMEYSLADYIVNFVLLAGSLIARPVIFARMARKERAESGVKVSTFPIGPVVRGFAIAIPILIVFSYLLAGADVVYNQKVIDFFDFDNMPDNIARLAIILFVGYLAAGVLLHAAAKSQDAKLTGEEKPLLRRFLGFIEAAIVLGSVVALFLLFVVIQFQYFFGGEVNIGVEGFTYSEYARRGFNELATVAFLSLLLTLGLSAITRREIEIERRIFSGLCVANAALVVVMLISASQRLSLAIDWHGFSRLRVYPRIFIIWVGILFVAVVVLELLRKERYFAFAALLASFGFAATLGLYNVDAAIVRHNVQRELQNKHLNINHLSSLSTDAVPALVQAFDNPALPKSTHEGVGAALLCFVFDDRRWTELHDDWRSFNYSQWRGSQQLESLQDKLNLYKVNDDGWLIRVRTPSNVWYDCAVE